MNDTKINLTIVIPVYNRAHCVGETLQSIASQEVKNFNIIVVDNSSTDNTVQVVEKFASEHPELNIKIFSEPKPGASNARNAGLDKVETEWTMFFDSDDLMETKHIGQVLDAIHKFPEVDLIGWDIIQEYDTLSIGKFASHPSHWSNLLNANFGTLRYCARTALFRKVGGWNSTVGLWDDIELGSRLLSVKPAIVKIKSKGTPQVRARRTEKSITGTDNISQLERLEPALKAIEETLPFELKFLTDIKRAHAYGCAARENKRVTRPYFDKLLSRTNSLGRKSALWMLYHTTRLGIRGTHHILRPFFGGM